MGVYQNLLKWFAIAAIPLLLLGCAPSTRTDSGEIYWQTTNKQSVGEATNKDKSESQNEQNLNTDIDNSLSTTINKNSNSAVNEKQATTNPPDVFLFYAPAYFLTKDDYNFNIKFLEDGFFTAGASHEVPKIYQDGNSGKTRYGYIASKPIELEHEFISAKVEIEQIESLKDCWVTVEASASADGSDWSEFSTTEEIRDDKFQTKESYFYGKSHLKFIRYRITILTTSNEGSKIKGIDIESKGLLTEKFWDYVEKTTIPPNATFPDFDTLDTLSKNVESNPVQLLIEGINHKNPIIRWYSAYKISEYLTNDNTTTLTKALNNLLDDPEEYVKKAASFTLSIINKTYDDPLMIKSKDGTTCAFVKFPEARFNDGNIWTITQDKMSLLYDGLNVGGLNWSPDGKWLSFTSSGRTWAETYVINSDTKKVYETDLFKYISKDASTYGYKIGSNQRADPWIGFLEWSPDSKKVLLSYEFTDDNYEMQQGIAVYNVEKYRIDKVAKISLEEEKDGKIIVPQNFNNIFGR